MTLKQARRELEKLGFRFDPKHKTLFGHLRFGTTDAEFYDVAPDHFVTKFRDVWISNKNPHFNPKTMMRFDISSNIVGKWRKYRTQKSYTVNAANIFSMGKNLTEAVQNFKKDFNSKRHI